ncbi:hypothetical protein ACIODS_29860 [Micromonospora chalcea]|uniref:hypothetical protein n=1 Tax=Micromonospora chalcea TaxID=1874 RepID=UPI0037FF9F7A
MIVQSGDAHADGLGAVGHRAGVLGRPGRGHPRRAAGLADLLRHPDQYLAGLPGHVRPLQAPEAWHLDWERMTRPGNVEAQFALFTDYADHVARSGEIAEYHSAHQPPALVLWGRHDAYFDVDEVLA